jgi:glycosyltransferase involved in cell wall biosynthesis
MDILSEYEKKYTYIRVFRNERQIGINENFFSAIKRATGDYIALSDQDDIWELDKIEIQVNTIGEKWLSCGFSKLFSSGQEIYFDKRIPNPSIERLIYVNTLAAGHTFLLNRKLLAYVPETTSILYDHIILIVAACNNMIAFTDKILANHREHEDSATFGIPVMQRGGNNKSVKNVVKSLFRTLKQFFSLRNDFRRHFSEIHFLLKELPDWDEKNRALKMAECQSKKGFPAFIKLIFYCIKARCHLFYTKENDTFLTFVRAIYFPVSSSDYFNYMLKKK